MEPAISARSSSWPTSNGSEYLHPLDSRASSRPVEETAVGECDLEKAVTSDEVRNGTSTGRISRLDSVTRRNTRADTFFHPLSHVKTTPENLVGFDGEDDPYRPLNWPFRKKVITTALYGLTTMGSTWASSV